MAWPALPTWRAPASVFWYSKAGRAWVAPAPSKNRSPVCACLLARTLRDFCIRWWSMSWAWRIAVSIGRRLRTAFLCRFSMGRVSNCGMTTMPARQEIRRFAPRDVKGWKAMSAVIRRLRDALRPAGDCDVWIGDAPSPEEIDARLGNDEEARQVLFHWSMAEFVEHYLEDRAAAVCLSWPGSHRHQGQPVRSRHCFHSVPPFVRAGWADCRACGAT